MAEIVITANPEAAAELAAGAILDMIESKPDAVLGLATGSTPLATYGALSRGIAQRQLDVSRVRGYALDEYVGLDEGHPESYRAVITREVVEPLGLTPSLVHVPHGALATIEHAGADYERELSASGGVDIQLLGIGTDGHIGFNEPGSSFGSITRVKTLTEQTRRDNARFFGSEDEVPMHCITQGLSTIMKARHLILLAFGSGKAQAVAGAVEGPVSAFNPASAIQLHPHVTVLLDSAAAVDLKNREYYEHAYRNKPAWQRL